MTGRFWLDWAMIAVSLFNTMLLLWLGLTVLFNANRRDWGVWLMGGGLLAGAVFFICHSAIVGQPLALNLDGLSFWWRVGWFPVMLLPFACSVSVLWYSGFWRGPGSLLARRHARWLWLLSLWLAGLLTLMLVANPIPAFDQVAPTATSQAFTVRQLPPLFLLFPMWMVVCILLAMDVLQRPAPTDDLNTLAARQRAHPWLLGAAATLLVVSLVVIYFIGRVLFLTTTNNLPVIHITTAAAYNLGVSLLIALAILLIGQAVIAYEVFTGRMLPRRSLVRHWRTAILLAAGYAAVVAGSLTANLRPIYSLLLATLLITLFYALYSWRALREREQLMARLRPFVQSPSSTPDARTPNAHTSSARTHAGTTTANDLLAALCHEVLDTRHAHLLPLGSMATLAGPGLSYPAGGESEARPRWPLPDLQIGMTRLDAATFAPYGWAIALWGEWGLSGALLIGKKREGGLYSQEEMEIAQATGERILQLLASEQMLQRLMALQRTRTVEQRVLDLHTRRTLHDEILPAVHLTMLQLRGATSPQAANGDAPHDGPVDADTVYADALATLADVHRQIATLLTNGQPAPLRAPDPSNLVANLRTLVGTEFRQSFAEIVWLGEAAPDDAARAIYVEAVTGEVILGAAREVIRNAALHGRGTRGDFPLRLTIDVRVMPNQLALAIQDNGVGLDTSKVAAPTGGSGNGLVLHSTLLAMVGGYLTIESPNSGGTRVTMTVVKGAGA